MMRRLHNAVLVLLVTAAPAFAQSEPSVPRAVQPDKFLWRADATFDRGKTWIRDYWTMEVHRISR